MPSVDLTFSVTDFPQFAALAKFTQAIDDLAKSRDDKELKARIKQLADELAEQGIERP